MEVIQINLKHCEAAQDLLWQNMAETKCDVAIISEPYRIPDNNGLWVTDKCKSAAINTSGRYPIQEVVSNTQEGFVVAKVNGVYLCSCYAPPRWTIEEFEEMLDTLTRVVINKKPIVIAGDFNAWAREWGSKKTNRRGKSILESLAKLDVYIANTGTHNTYHGNGHESIIDITFCSQSIINNTNWRVTEEYTGSDHYTVRYKVRNAGIRKESDGPRTSCQSIRWKTKELNKEMLCDAFELMTGKKDKMTARQLTNIVRDACDMAMPRKTNPKHRRKPAYWWNDEIAGKRAKCHKARRQAQRAKTDVSRVSYGELYRAARAELVHAIKESKKLKFRELCESINDSPWGLGYKTAMAKLKGPTYGKETHPDKLKVIIDELFPTHKEAAWMEYGDGNHTDDRMKERKITDEELLNIAKRLSLNKAPGPDGIPNEVLKVLITNYPGKFRRTFQQCLDDCHFPDIWKKAKLVLLPKPGKAPGDPTGHRPLCLLDTLGKVLESIITNRLVEYTENSTGLSDRQFGFRKGRSTTDAISLVTERAKQAIESHTKANRYCAITTIDVKNAFNSANWELIGKALNDMGVSKQLRGLIQSYLTNRFLIYDTEIGPVTRRVTAGVPQGSIQGPILWNILYDSILRLDLPEKVEIVGFADDIVTTTLGDTIDEVKVNTEWAGEVTGDWLEQNKLQRAHQKTEIVIVTNRRQHVTTQIEIGGHTITSKRHLKYLGVMVDDRLSFSRHIDYVSGKAAKVQTTLARIMPNTFGPTSSKRRMLANVTTSILRYGGEIWWETAKKRRNWEILNSVHRLSAIRVTSAYRTISFEAVCVISGMMPICILLEEDSKCGKSKKSNGVKERTTHNEQSVKKWQEVWERSGKGRWTYRLIPMIEPWIRRAHGETDYFLTQFLSGHGGFNEYLHRMGKIDSPLCPTCRQIETPEHVLFRCTRFDEERKLAQISPEVNADNLIRTMCESKSAWTRITYFMRRTLTKLNEERSEE